MRRSISATVLMLSASSGLLFAPSVGCGDGDDVPPRERDDEVSSEEEGYDVPTKEEEEEEEDDDDDVLVPEITSVHAVDMLGTTATGPTGSVPSYQGGTIPVDGTISDTNPHTSGYWDFDYTGLNEGVFNDTVQLTDATGANVGNPVVLYSAGHDYSSLPDGAVCNPQDTFQVVLEVDFEGTLIDVAVSGTPVGSTAILTTWSSDDPAVVSVSADGLLTAESENACTTISWSVEAEDPDLLRIEPDVMSGTFAACVDSGGVDSATRAVWLPVGDLDANLPGLPSGPPLPLVGETVTVTWIVNVDTKGVGAYEARSEFDSVYLAEDASVDVVSIGGSTQSKLGVPFAVDPDADASATQLPDASQWNDVDAFGTHKGIFDLSSQTFTAVSVGPAELLYANEELMDGTGCTIWITNPCLPFNSTTPCTSPPEGGYVTIAGSGTIEVLPP